MKKYPFSKVPFIVDDGFVMAERYVIMSSISRIQTILSDRVQLCNSDNLFLVDEEMALHWRADGGPTLNHGLVAL